MIAAIAMIKRSAAIVNNKLNFIDSKIKDAIVKACDDGKQKIVRFGYRGMQDFLQHKDPKRRASFKARHKCSEKKDKLTPGWWACNYNW